MGIQCVYVTFTEALSTCVLDDQVLKLGKALASHPVCGLGMRLGRYGNETTGMWPWYEARKVRE